MKILWNDAQQTMHSYCIFLPTAADLNGFIAIYKATIWIPTQQTKMVGEHWEVLVKW